MGSEKLELYWIAVTIFWAISLSIIVFWIVPGFIVVPWLPTSGKTVDKMLSMANVNADEVVYDLGSGDGRVVIAAAKKFQARSVGVELNPLWVFWTRLKVTILGLRSKTKIVWGNLFSADLSKADVVTLYLMQTTNSKLEPKLKKELKPGSRVVSHVFKFNNWNPAKKDTKSQIYLYIVEN